jgi:hypothetical protein
MTQKRLQKPILLRSDLRKERFGLSTMSHKLLYRLEDPDGRFGDDTHLCHGRG